MVKRFWVTLILLPFCSCTGVGTRDSTRAVPLWPNIEPFRAEYLKVSDIHEISYELCGNPQGKPVFVLHGGPGASCSPYLRRFFNPEKFLIVLHDERGAGKSRPSAEIRQNTTQDLVEDIERLRQHLKLGKIVLFGGSWGTTLGLAYAETYPENVAGLVLRGVFTATKEEIDYYYHGGVRNFFPDAYEKLLSALPDSTVRPLPDYLFKLVQTQDAAEDGKYSKAWEWYEFKISGLDVPDTEIEQYLATTPDADKGAYTMGLFENYYMANRCFLEEGQLLRDAGRIASIPTVIVNGRYDAICPPVTAYRLHQRLPKSKLIIAERAGHWIGEPPIEQALLKAMREFE